MDSTLNSVLHMRASSTSGRRHVGNSYYKVQDESAVCSLYPHQALFTRMTFLLCAQAPNTDADSNNTDGPEHRKGTLSYRQKIYNPLLRHPECSCDAAARAQAAHAGADRTDADGLPRVQETLSFQCNTQDPWCKTLNACVALLCAQAAHADADRIDADGLPHVGAVAYPDQAYYSALDQVTGRFVGARGKLKP